uniref:Metalloendopeptidase n=1 Tax=Megaselia scalaris TaxID=36166 RepID=T1GF66_MEGSC
MESDSKGLDGQMELYIRVTNYQDGCFSSVGYWEEVQQLNIGPFCEYEGTVIHEFLHAIGFFHQQSSYERDLFIDIIWENIEEGKDHNFDKRKIRDVTNFRTLYDYSSIMHYGESAFSKNGKPTMVAKFPEGQDQMGAREMSPTDIYKINRMYNCEI